ncbi:DUF6153 family protein [Rhodococcus sp. NPDC003318]|uniref:DUF6153 family protein n=1 Tax=Rhodococcus sp. NPDC003318 TaxID=3364503 RepID=UPI00367AECF8
MSRPITTRTGAHRAVLLLAVILGVLAMHHVATTTTAAATPAAAHVTTDHPGAGMPDHDGTGGHSDGQHMLATCLAVLSSGVALLVVLMLFGVITDPGTRPDRRRVVPAGFGRGPPFARPTSTRLAALCLLRV